MLHRMIWGVLTVAILLFLPACVQLGDSNTNDLLADYYSASSPEELQSAIDQLVQSGVKAEELANRLREGKKYSANVPVGWAIYYIDGPDGRTRPYHVYVPTDYDPAESYTVLYDLHGAVSMQPQPAEYLIERRRLWEPEAEEYGWILIVPHGDRLASWFSADGHANILGELDFVKHQYNVDESKVFVVRGFRTGARVRFGKDFTTPLPGQPSSRSTGIRPSAAMVPISPIRVISSTAPFGRPRGRRTSSILPAPELPSRRSVRRAGCGS